MSLIVASARSHNASSLASRVALVAVISTLALSTPMVIAPAGAAAGIYHVYSCSRPDGRLAPTDGWGTSSIGGVGPDSGDSNTCARGGSLSAVVSAQAQQNAYTGPEWIFTAPPGTRIAGGALTATLTSPHGQAWLGSPNPTYDAADVIVNCQFNEPCGQSGVFTGVFPILSPGGTSIYAIAVCVGPYEGATTCPAASGVDAAISVSAANIALTTTTAPSASAVGGSLLDDQVLDGPQNILITASDPGPGVYEAIFQLDGRTVSSPVIDTNNGRCQNAGGTSDGTAAFLYLQPCPSQLNSVEVPFDPAVAPEGPHDLKVLVSDAAGNTTTILDHQVVVDNSGAYTTLLTRGACNGTACDDHARLSQNTRQRATFTRHFSRSGLTLAGRLVDHAGAPIKGAQVKLLEQPSEPGAPTREVESVSTDQAGTWVFKIPRGPSRLLRVAYFSHLKDTTPATQLDYHERVSAAVSLRAPAHVHAGRSVVFYGHLVGGYFPRQGEPVQMEIFYAGRWRTIEVLNTDQHGRWAYRYVFSIAGGSYLFRAVTLSNVGYPFLAGDSPPIRVKVQG
jgi:hypothetical protein